MKRLEGRDNSFIVRVWLEPREIEGANLEWRGRIEHVQSGDHAYFRDLNRMEEFIINHLGYEGKDSLLAGKREGGTLRRLLHRLLPRKTMTRGNYV